MIDSNFNADYVRNINKQYLQDPSTFLGDQGIKILTNMIKEIENAARTGHKGFNISVSEMHPTTKQIMFDYFKAKNFDVKFSYFKNYIKVRW